jgi:hypothetical protein
MRSGEQREMLRAEESAESRERRGELTVIFSAFLSCVVMKESSEMGFWSKYCGRKGVRGEQREMGTGVV